MPRLRKAAVPVGVSDNAPMSPDEILLKENIPATGQMPAEYVEQMSERIVYVSNGLGESPQFTDVEPHKGKAIRLPEGAFLGMLGDRGELFVTPESTDYAEASPYRPEWESYVYHPKFVAEQFTPDMRGVDGTRIRPHRVYNPDNRTFVFPSGYPMRCVGRIEVWDTPGTVRPQRLGSAVLVGRRVLLTASHLMPRNGNPGRWAVRFTPGYFNGSSTVGLSSWCEGYRVAATLTGPNDELQARDVAVMKLYTPLGDAIGWWGARSYDDDWEDEARWSLMGYPGVVGGVNTMAERPTIQNGIPVVDDDPDGRFAEIEHRGDASDGNSGGPLFGTWPDGPYAIGVHSGDEYRTVLGVVVENNNVAAGGTGMVDMILKARADWP